MADGEEPHLAAFAVDLARRKVRPMALLQLPHVAEYALGEATTGLPEYNVRLKFIPSGGAAYQTAERGAVG